MTTGRIQLDRRGHVLLIGLDRAAKRNAFDLALWDAVCLAYGELDRDPELRVGVLHALGDHFTGGLDLPAWAPIFASGRFHIPDGGLDPLGLSGRRLGKPIVAAVQGICLTIGIELMLATDVRIAAASTRFGQIEIKRGIYPVGGATLRFPREVGWANAMRWLLTGDEFDAAEALRIGLVQEVVAPGEQLARATALADVIAQQAPLGVYATLASARAALPEAEAAAAIRLLPDLQPLMNSEDMQEGLRAFMERRPGSFQGR
ncbi:MAG: crotonase/enoyl-CoA hydratase family protein [Deltaproteobacteria bacterium]|nr:crotonase/enoyl-CoA hydratase family protein [Deltaproteobacteria bacterium]MDQ3297736.1 crotonase/enoyl-CoA hydratase family protein [Myxococcota bacterium]